MLQFLWPWVFFILPLPLIIRLASPKKSVSNDAALHVPYLEDFQLHVSTTSKINKRWAFLFYLIAWCFLVSATARPQWIGEPIELPVSGRDIMLAIDLSNSMSQAIRYGSRKVTKLDATKAVAGDFINKRVGDRIGLILFGEQAYVQAPLTFDRSTVITLLSEAVPGLAGRSTAIGDAIGLAVKRLTEDNDEQVLILLTDGVSNSGEIQPEKAAELAAKKGLKIHSIGIGNRGSRDLNEASLKDIARQTGGQYFRAHDVKELQDIYRLIDQLEPIEKDTQSYRPSWSLFYWRLSVALALASLLLVFRLRGWL